MVLRALDAHRAGLIVGGEHALDDVDVGRDAELLAAGLAARLQVDGRARDEERRVHRRRECAERRDEALDLDPFRLRGLLVLGIRGKAARPTTSKLAAAALHAYVIIGALPRSRCGRSEARRRRSRPRSRERAERTRRLAEASSSMSRLTWRLPRCGPRGSRSSARRCRGSRESSPGGRAPKSRPASASRSWPPAFRARSSSPSTRAARLVVLSHGARGDAAGEIYRLDLDAALPVDASRAPRVVIPFADEPRKAALGSLAIDPRAATSSSARRTATASIGWATTSGSQPVAVGLNHLLGGSALTLDRAGSLVFLDYASSETHLRSETPLPPSLSWLTDEGYRGPLVFRIDPREDRPLPRRADLLAADLSPSAEPARLGREPLWRLIGVAAPPGDDLVFLSSVGEVLRARRRRRASSRRPAPGRSLPPHQHDHGPRRQRLRLRRISDPADLPHLAGRLGRASWPASWAIPAASCSTRGRPSTSRRPPSTASSASRPDPLIKPLRPSRR